MEKNNQKNLGSDIKTNLKKIRNKKGVALIIVVFAMMVFAVLGWTLAVMLSTDF